MALEANYPLVPMTVVGSDRAKILVSARSMPEELHGVYAEIQPDFEQN